MSAAAFSWTAVARCPVCQSAFAPGAFEACGACGTAFPTIGDVPILVPDTSAADVDLRETGGTLPRYDCAGLGIEEVDAALARGDRILELGAGLEITQHENVVRTDAFVYDDEHLDVVADAHRLPFADESFDFVFSLAVFEHLHSPWIAAREMARVLRPGGRAYTLCAFLQPLHGYPSHYFNMTEFGLRRIFEDDFTVERAGPSRHTSHSESAVQLHRMREMAEALDPSSLGARDRLRRTRLIRSLWTASHQFQQFGDRLLEAEAGRESWRAIAPAVEVVAVRAGA